MAAGIEIYNYVTNQKGSPAIYSDTLTNRPAAGFIGRLFVSTNTLEIYRDNGTTWDLISGGGGPSVNIYNSNGTLTGARTMTMANNNLTFDGGANPARLIMSASNNITRSFSFATAGATRWAFTVDDNETGTNTGGNWYLRAYTDAGAFLFDPISVERATGEKSMIAIESLDNGSDTLTGVYNITGGTYFAGLTMIGGNPHGASHNNYTLANAGNLTFANSIYLGAQSNVLRLQANNSGTITLSPASPGIRTAAATLNQIQYNTTTGAAITYTHASVMQTLGFYRLFAAGSLTVTNAYGLIVNDLNEYGYAAVGAGALAFTNRWGIYQDSTTDVNYFGGTTLIGTTTNAGYKLDVSGTLRNTLSANFGTTSGNVGIGTIINNAKLHVLSATGTFQSAGDWANNITVIQGGNRTGTATVGGSFATTISLQSNDDTFAANTGASIGFAAKWNSSIYNSAAQFASIFGGKENSTDANLAGYLSFATRPAGGNPTVRLRITSDGNVGIGTTSPLAVANYIGLSVSGTNGSFTSLYTGASQIGRLEVNGTSDFTIKSIANVPLILGTNNTEKARISSIGEFTVGFGTASTISFTTGAAMRATNSTNTSSFEVGLLGGPGSADAFVYQRHNAAMIFATNNTERARITPGGNVLIGSTTDPGAKLYVNGVTYINNTSSAGDYYLQVSGGIYATNNSVNLSIATQNNRFIAGEYGIGVGTGTFDASQTNGINVRSGTAPTTNVADVFVMYAADITAGNAAPHFRTENGNTVKIYQETTGVGSATFASPGAGSTVKTDDTFDGYTLQQVVKALRNLGILA